MTKQPNDDLLIEEVLAGILPKPRKVTLQAVGEVQPRASGHHSIQFNSDDPDLDNYPAIQHCLVTMGRHIPWQDFLQRCGPIRFLINKHGATVPCKSMPEGYTLGIGPSRKGHSGIEIAAEDIWGCLRGLSTLYQYVQHQHGQHRSTSENVPVMLELETYGLVIEDEPRFAWRGLLIDVARHFIDLDTLKRIVDGMWVLKLNVLHLHLTDDQAFRFGSERWPNLVHQQHYTKAQLQALVTYAGNCGIRVIAEIDMPGHVNCWLHGYPDLALAEVQQSYRFGVHKACLNPIDERVYKMLFEVLEEVSECFPDEYLHIGGDEVHPTWWNENAAIQEFMQTQKMQSAADVQNYFMHRVQQILAQLGKRAIAWDEVLHPDMPQLLVQNWRGATTRDHALARSLECIISAGYYLDLMYPCEYHYGYDPTAGQKQLMAYEDAWQSDPRMSHVADGVEWTKQWRKDAIDLDIAAHEIHVLGGEACLWSELVNNHTIETRLWSRLPAVAERFWSAREVNDVADFYTRLVPVLGLPELDIHERQNAAFERLGLSKAQIEIVVYLEPVKWYARLLGEQALQARLMGNEMPKARPYDCHSPLDSIIDHLTPESLPARQIVNGDWQGIVAQANVWAQTNTDLWPQAIQPAIAALNKLGELILAREHGSVKESTYQQRLQALDKTYGEYILPMVSGLRGRNPAADVLVQGGSS